LLNEWMPVAQPFGWFAQRRLKLFPHVTFATLLERRSCILNLAAVTISKR
jgi:hypothetical protein